MKTKTWKVNTPSISQTYSSFSWDWSNDQDGKRILSCFCADLTGMPSYILFQITRDTDDECYNEFEGQLTDGFFENYYGDIKFKEIRSVKIDTKLCYQFILELKEKLGKIPMTINEQAIAVTSLHDELSTMCAVIRGLKLRVEGFSKEREAAEEARIQRYGWNQIDTPETNMAIKKTNDELLHKVWVTVSEAEKQISSLLNK